MPQHADEILDLVAPDGRVIGQARRADCHRDPRLLHPVAHVLVFRPDGALMLQKRSAGKDTYPGLWDTSVGGHLQPGESPVAGARREAAEELGAGGLELEFCYRHTWHDSNESELVYTYRARGEQDELCPDGTEVSEIRAWSPAEIDAALGTGVLTPSFEHEWRLWQKHSGRSPARAHAEEDADQGDPHSRALRRHRRMDAPGTWFITKRLQPAHPVLTRSDLAEEITRTFRFSCEHGRIHLAAFCVMPDHWHALFAVLDSTLPRVMRLIDRWIGRRSVSIFQNAGVSWQDGYHDTRIVSNRQFQHVLNYIEVNPVRESLVAERSDWPWSSANGAHQDMLTRPWPWPFERDVD